MKKKIFALLALACSAAVLGACSGGSSSSSSTTAAAAEAADDAQEADTTIKTVNPGVLTVATSPDFAPYEFYAIDANGKPSLAGFDIALAGYIADELGLELEIVTVDFDGVLSELQTKSVDLGMAGLSPDETRMKIMDFTDVYYKGGQSVMSTKLKAEQYKSFDDLNQPGVVIGAQTGSIQIDLAKTNTPDADLVSLPKVTDLVTELLSGKMDAAFVETDVANSYKKNYPDLEVLMDVPYEHEGSAIGVAKGNEALLAAVNEAIAKAIEDGSMETFVAEANEQASGEKYEGLLDESGNIQ